MAGLRHLLQPDDCYSGSALCGAARSAVARVCRYRVRKRTPHTRWPTPRAGTVQALIILGGYGSDVARVSNHWNHARGIFFSSCVLYTLFFATQITVFVRGTTESGAPAVVNLFVRSGAVGCTGT